MLGLKKIEDGRWQVILNEQGLRLINRTFQNESDACRFFLKSVLDDPIFWTYPAVPYVGSGYQAYLTRHLELLARYGFTRGEGDFQFWYFLIFVILFLGISIAPLLVVAYCFLACSMLWGLVARIAYILGWLFFGFSKVSSRYKSRYDRFIGYRFGWVTEGQAIIVYLFCGGVVALFYVVYAVLDVKLILMPK